MDVSAFGLAAGKKHKGPTLTGYSESIQHSSPTGSSVPNIGSRMNREVHVRIRERPEVRVLWATRHQERLRYRCGFREGTFVGTRANGRHAPISDIAVVAEVLGRA